MIALSREIAPSEKLVQLGGDQGQEFDRDGLTTKLGAIGKLTGKSFTELNLDD